jgi:hypothetical protein
MSPGTRLLLAQAAGLLLAATLASAEPSHTHLDAQHAQQGAAPGAADLACRAPAAVQDGGHAGGAGVADGQQQRGRHLDEDEEGSRDHGIG